MVEASWAERAYCKRRGQVGFTKKPTLEQRVLTMAASWKRAIICIIPYFNLLGKYMWLKGKYKELEGRNMWLKLEKEQYIKWLKECRGKENANTSSKV